MVGYRGVDGSVSLACPEVVEAYPAAQPLGSESLRRIGKALTAAHGRLRRDGVDLDGYTMVDVADDIEAARLALGYDEINLWSHSYGTQVAYITALRYPDHIRRSLLTGASAPGRLTVWDPTVVEAQLAIYGDLWAADPACRRRHPNLVEAIREVLHALPRRWHGVELDAGKLRVMSFRYLFNTGTAAQLFDAFAAALEGDDSGLTYLCLAFDHGRQGMLSAGDFACKVLSSGDVDPDVDYETMMDPPGVTLGSPVSKLNWGPLKYGAWPIRQIPAAYRGTPTPVRSLVVNGTLDVSSPLVHAEEELMPLLPNGSLVVPGEMGHNDVIVSQGKAYRHLWQTFFSTGEVDSSRFTHQPVDFVPTQTLQSLGRRWLAQVGG